MSVMVLNLKTIEKLGNNISIIKKVTYDSVDLNKWENLLKEAYHLNIKSWNLRYPSDIIDDAEEIVFIYFFNLFRFIFIDGFLSK